VDWRLCFKCLPTRQSFLNEFDLSLVAKGDNVSDDENAISNLNGIYYYTSGLQTNSFGTTYSNVTGVKVTFDSNGNIVGGFADDLVIKPMQDFIVKLNSNAIQTLKFNKTRRFAQTARNSSTAYSVTAARMSSLNNVTKQLAVVLYDANDVELGRTFYVVNSDATTGYSPEHARMQAITDNNSLYTREEQLVGGDDTNTTYGLQINEANESDF
jgi:hypothetical protein